MHKTMFDDLSIKTYLLQFYCYLARGFLDSDGQLSRIDALIHENIDRLTIMADGVKWDGRYDLVFNQIVESNATIEQAKSFLKYKQNCRDVAIADFIIAHPLFMSEGIILNELKSLLNIEAMFRDGYMLHDVFAGYPERDLYSFQVDCLDYLHSAAHFYNEAYDLYHGRKSIKFYDDESYGPIHAFEMRRIQPREEVMFRNFREAFINIIFFIESFFNSVGIDALLQGCASTEEDENRLKGFSVAPKGRKHYFNLRDRIKAISEVISGTQIDVQVEPLNSYLEVDVELRNQYVHSSASRPKSTYTMEDWKAKCDEMISGNCSDVLHQFWKHCYPVKPFPKVIFNVLMGNSFKGHRGRFFATEI